MAAAVCKIGFQPEGGAVANIPFGGKTFPLSFKDTIPALKGKENGTIIVLPEYITPQSLKAYFQVREALTKAVRCSNGKFEPPCEVTFEVAKIAELMLDIDFFNKISLQHCNIDLDTVSYKQLGPLTGCLCLNLLLEKCKAEVAVECGYERTRETMPKTLISDKLATSCQKSIPKDWKLYMETPDTRTAYCRWPLRMEKFLTTALGRWFWENSKGTRRFIVTILQVNVGKRDAAIGRQYAIRRQDQTTGRPMTEVWCQHDKQKKNHKNCDDLDDPCSNCKGVLSWVRSNLPSEAEQLEAEIVDEEWRIWKSDPKYGKTDYDEILNGSEVEAGYKAQRAEIRKMAESNVAKRRAKMAKA